MPAPMPSYVRGHDDEVDFFETMDEHERGPKGSESPLSITEDYSSSFLTDDSPESSGLPLDDSLLSSAASISSDDSPRMGIRPFELPTLTDQSYLQADSNIVAVDKVTPNPSLSLLATQPKSEEVVAVHQSDDIDWGVRASVSGDIDADRAHSYTGTVSFEDNSSDEASYKVSRRGRQLESSYRAAELSPLRQPWSDDAEETRPIKPSRPRDAAHTATKPRQASDPKILSDDSSDDSRPSKPWRESSSKGAFPKLEVQELPAEEDSDQEGLALVVDDSPMEDDEEMPTEDDLLTVIDEPEELVKLKTQASANDVTSDLSDNDETTEPTEPEAASVEDAYIGDDQSEGEWAVVESAENVAVDLSRSVPVTAKTKATEAWIVERSACKPMEAKTVGKGKTLMSATAIEQHATRSTTNSKIMALISQFEAPRDDKPKTHSVLPALVAPKSSASNELAGLAHTKRTGKAAPVKSIREMASKQPPNSFFWRSHPTTPTGSSEMPGATGMIKSQVKETRVERVAEKDVTSPPVESPFQRAQKKFVDPLVLRREAARKQFEKSNKPPWAR